MHNLNRYNKNYFESGRWFAKMFIAVYILTVACNKKFDEPPGFEEPDIQPNLTIKALKALHTNGSFEKITDNTIIAGIVIADDKSGNFYKSIVLQDATGGIVIRLDGYSLFTDYPVGRKLYIRLNGLYLGDYKKWIQLGGGIDNSDPTQISLLPIANGLFDQYIAKGSPHNTVAPKVIKTTTQLKDSLQSMLVQLDNFQFADADTGKTYADAVNKQSVNFTIKNCSNQRIILRNSGYASYAGLKVPKGNGSVVAVYSVYNSTKQLLMNDTAGVHFSGSRCNVVTTLLTQDFEKTTATANIAIDGWRNVAEKGNVLFSSLDISGNQMAKISAFGTNEASVKTWLVTPVFNLDTTENEVLTFKTKDGYDNGATLKVYYSLDYLGDNSPWTANWTPLTAKISSGHPTGYGTSWISSGKIKLDKLAGDVYLAFVYEGADVTNNTADKTTTFELDDILVTGD